MTVISTVFSLIAAVFIGLFFYFYLLRTFQFWIGARFLVRHFYVKAGAGVLSAGLAFLSYHLLSMPALIILHVVVLALILELINLPVRLISERKGTTPSIWNKVHKSGILPVLLTLLIISYGYWNIGNVRETYYAIYTEKPIAQTGYRILMISDLHFGTVIEQDSLKNYCEKMNRENADLVVLCGDIVDENTTREQLDQVFALLGKLKNKLGIYYVFGNHDKGAYRPDPDFTEQDLRSVLQSNHITVLEDQCAVLNEELAIVGRKDRSEIRKQPDALTAGIDKNYFILTIDHQPAEFIAEEKAGTDLLLSGHTHAGQIWPVGLLIQPLGFAEQCYGYNSRGSLQSVVSSGFTGWGYPIRTQGHSEYVVIDILRK